MSEHTATPWTVKSNTSLMAGERGIATTHLHMGDWPEEIERDKANAAFIVRAVNAHDALVKELREQRSTLDALLTCDYCANCEYCNSHTLITAALKAIDAALKLAEGNACTCPTPDFHAINCPARDDAAHWANR